MIGGDLGLLRPRIPVAPLGRVLGGPGVAVPAGDLGRGEPLVGHVGDPAADPDLGVGLVFGPAEEDGPVVQAVAGRRPGWCWAGRSRRSPRPRSRRPPRFMPPSGRLARPPNGRLSKIDDVAVEDGPVGHVGLLAGEQPGVRLVVHPAVVGHVRHDRAAAGRCAALARSPSVCITRSSGEAKTVAGSTGRVGRTGGASGAGKFVSRWRPWALAGCRRGRCGSGRSPSRTGSRSRAVSDGHGHALARRRRPGTTRAGRSRPAGPCRRSAV